MLSIATKLAEVPGVAPVVDVTVPVQYYINFPTMLSQVLSVALTIGVVMVLLYLVWGGIDWISSGGDKGKTESARNKITAGIVGLVILVSAWALLMFVQMILFGPGNEIITNGTYQDCGGSPYLRWDAASQTCVPQ